MVSVSTHCAQFLGAQLNEFGGTGLCTSDSLLTKHFTLLCDMRMQHKSAVVVKGELNLNTALLGMFHSILSTGLKQLQMTFTNFPSLCDLSTDGFTLFGMWLFEEEIKRERTKLNVSCPQTVSHHFPSRCSTWADVWSPSVSHTTH